MLLSSLQQPKSYWQQPSRRDMQTEEPAPAWCAIHWPIHPHALEVIFTFCCENMWKCWLSFGSLGNVLMHLLEANWPDSHLETSPFTGSFRHDQILGRPMGITWVLLDRKLKLEHWPNIRTAKKKTASFRSDLSLTIHLLYSSLITPAAPPVGPFSNPTTSILCLDRVLSHRNSSVSPMKSKDSNRMYPPYITPCTGNSCLPKQKSIYNMYKYIYIYNHI